jgi:hypothetical protein
VIIGEDTLIKFSGVAAGQASKVEAISPPVTSARRSMPSKSACSMDIIPASVNSARVKVESTGKLAELEKAEREKMRQKVERIKAHGWRSPTAWAG